MNRAVVVTFRFEGIHSWPECPIKEVEFLKHPHRHEFHVKALKIVEHNDRDVEIIVLKRTLKDTVDSFKGDFSRMSCEDIAEMLIERHDLYTCEVLEDGENGAMLWK